MKGNKLFDTETEEKQMTMVIAGIALHGLLAGRATAEPRPVSVNTVDDAFDIAMQFMARMKELTK